MNAIHHSKSTGRPTVASVCPNLPTIPVKEPFKLMSQNYCSHPISLLYTVYTLNRSLLTFIIRMFAITREPWQFSKMLMIGREKSKQDDNTRMKMIVNKCDCHYRRKKKSIYIFLLLQLTCVCVCVACTNWTATQPFSLDVTPNLSI